MLSVSAMIHYCALPDKSIGNWLAAMDTLLSWQHSIPDRFLTGFDFP